MFPLSSFQKAENDAGTMVSLHSGNVHCVCCVSCQVLNEFISNVILDKTTEDVRMRGCVENEGGSSNKIVNIFLARVETPIALDLPQQQQQQQH